MVEKMIILLLHEISSCDDCFVLLRDDNDDKDEVDSNDKKAQHMFFQSCDRKTMNIFFVKTHFY